jgi:hypothetical protein
MFLYIAGPLTKGDLMGNVRRSMEAAHLLLDHGYEFYLPHLSVHLEMFRPRPYREWLDMDLRLIPYCDGIFLLPGESPGAQEEVALANKLGMPVFTSIEEVNAFARDN